MRSALKSRQRWAVWISGRGSNLQAVLDLQESFAVGLVISSRAQAPGVKKARRMGVPVELMSHQQPDWQRLQSVLQEYGITHVFLLGFMRIVPAEVIAAFAGRMINLHPSLLPQHKGLNAIEKSFATQTGVGASVHLVTPGLDEGAVLSQRALEPLPQSLDQAKFLIATIEQRLVRQCASFLQIT